MNVIELVTKYLPILDEQYRAESRSAILDMPGEFVVETKDAKKVKFAMMRTDKLGDYSRHAGFAEGYADLVWEEHTFTQDRGRAIQVDVMDNEETFGLAFGRLTGEFQRKAVIPELDAYRFATYYQHAGIKKAFVVSGNAILSLIDDLDAEMDNLEVPEDDRVLFVIPSVFKLMINDPALVKHINVVDSSDKAINKKIYMYDNHEIVKVPNGRFYTAITTLDGKSAGKEEGGYVKAEGASQIGLMMIHRGAVIQLAKRAIARIWAPSRELAVGTDGVNPNADAWKFDYRLYHDAWTLEEKVSGIAAAVVTGEGVGSDEVIGGSYDSSTKVFSDEATYELTSFGSYQRITGEIPYKAADATLGLEAGNRIDLKFVNSNITSKESLPAGVIARTRKSDGTWQTYTKEAFEDDGSLILCGRVNDNRVGLVEVTWFTGNTTVYTLDTTMATLASE